MEFLSTYGTGIIVVNTYKIKFNAICPVNEDEIQYFLTIKTSKMIQVEAIKEFTDRLSRGFHEKFADMLHGKFGGYQLMTAIHGGVTIETERGLA
jgi:hypothetical protein